MTVQILNKHFQQVAEGKNLDILNQYARRMHGVKRIVIDPLGKNEEKSAEVTVYFKRGFMSTVRFASLNVAEKWATKKSTHNGTYWTGCVIIDRSEL
jgi:hypothetical protein